MCRSALLLYLTPIKVINHVWTPRDDTCLCIYVLDIDSLRSLILDNNITRVLTMTSALADDLSDVLTSIRTKSVRLR